MKHILAHWHICRSQDGLAWSGGWERLVQDEHCEGSTRVAWSRRTKPDQRSRQTKSSRRPRQTKPNHNKNLAEFDRVVMIKIWSNLASHPQAKFGRIWPSRPWPKFVWILPNQPRFKFGRIRPCRL